MRVRPTEMLCLPLLAFCGIAALLQPEWEADDPSRGQQKGWRSCLSEEFQADSCATEIFETLEQCRAFNAIDPYARMDGADCFDNIDEVPENQGGHARF